MPTAFFNYWNTSFFYFQVDKSKSAKDPGSADEQEALVKHSDINGTHV